MALLSLQFNLGCFYKCGEIQLKQFFIHVKTAYLRMSYAVFQHLSQLLIFCFLRIFRNNLQNSTVMTAGKLGKKRPNLVGVPGLRIPGFMSECLMQKPEFRYCKLIITWYYIKRQDLKTWSSILKNLFFWMIQNLQPLKKSSNLLRHAEKKEDSTWVWPWYEQTLLPKDKVYTKVKLKQIFFSGSKQAKDITRFVL